MKLDRVHGDPELLRDLGIRHTFGDELEHVELSPREAAGGRRGVAHKAFGHTPMLGTAGLPDYESFDELSAKSRPFS